MRKLVLDVDDWNAAGEDLLEVDPTRFAFILATVRDIVAIHRDPIGAKADDAATFEPLHARDNPTARVVERARNRGEPNRRTPATGILIGAITKKRGAA
jgi:hypothetical protein